MMSASAPSPSRTPATIARPRKHRIATTAIEQTAHDSERHSEDDTNRLSSAANELTDAVQEAMAREPKPVHVPREPKPVVAIDEGPLVLVETRKDLTQFKLPFETQASSQQPQA